MFCKRWPTVWVAPLRATRCLVIRTDGLPLIPMVTHEYVEPDLSPLGLGRTGQFPMFAISLFTQRTAAYADVAQIKSSGPLMPTEVDQLTESGIVSMAGAPLSYQGQPFGVLILVDGARPRKWTEEELETIELTAGQASVALSHSQTYHQAKDQLFHMNLLGNLHPAADQCPGGGDQGAKQTSLARSRQRAIGGCDTAFIARAGSFASDCLWLCQ